MAYGDFAGFACYIAVVEARHENSGQRVEVGNGDFLALRPPGTSSFRKLRPHSLKVGDGVVPA